ncbi:MAG: energy transducer TonB, partial [Chlorobiaceae bacterium]|nr:energy transducer TonB [Chlorobiaceae bacterium]
FDAAAMKAVMDAKYAPGIQNGSPVKVWFTVPIRFQLD